MFDGFCRHVPLFLAREFKSVTNSESGEPTVLKLGKTKNCGLTVNCAQGTDSESPIHRVALKSPAPWLERRELAKLTRSLASLAA
jgi:hypothetical protein